MAIWQLANCYLLLGLIGSFVLRAARDALKNDLAAQEKVVKAYLLALAIADLSHIAVTLIALPEDIALNPLDWNMMTHGNVTFVVLLFTLRMAWMAGVGRTSALRTSPKIKQL